MRDAVSLYNVKTVIVASSTGETALKALEILRSVSDRDTVKTTNPVSDCDSDKDMIRSSNTSSVSGKTYTPPKLVVVTHVTGFSEPDKQDMPMAVRQTLEAAGATVVTAAHSLGGINRAVRMKFGTYGMDELFAYTLRIFGQGTKVAVEIAMMAADAGAVSSHERLISISGSGSGADTAILLQPANTHRFFDLRIDRIICKPGVSEVWKRGGDASGVGQ